MKLGIFSLGVLLIISAVSEYSLTPMILDKVNNITNTLETSMIPTMTNNPPNQAYASMMTDANAQASKFTSGLTTIETKVTDYASWGIALMGVGFVSYGMLAKNNHKIRSNNSEALDIMKKRLATGEITKKQFDQLKNDVT